MKVQNPYISFMVSLAVIGIGGLGKTLLGATTQQAAIQSTLEANAKSYKKQEEAITNLVDEMRTLSIAQLRQEFEIKTLRSDFNYLKNDVNQLESKQKKLKRSIEEGDTTVP